MNHDRDWTELESDYDDHYDFHNDHIFGGEYDDIWSNYMGYSEVGDNNHIDEDEFEYESVHYPSLASSVATDINPLGFYTRWYKNLDEYNTSPRIQILKTNRPFYKRTLGWMWGSDVILHVQTKSCSYLGKVLTNGLIKDIPSKLDVLLPEIMQYIVAFVGNSPF